MRLRVALLALLAAPFVLAGCASTDPATGQPRESTIPWNRPQSWEGPGVMGSAINQQ